MSEELTLEIVEGPGAGRQVTLDGPVILGRGDDADLVMEDGEVSRHHVRVTPQAGGFATVEDLGSANGTFLNQNELVGPARLDPGDELLVGVTMLQLRSAEQVRRAPSAVIEIPPGLATAARPPTYVNPDVVRAETAPDQGPAGITELNRLLDVKVRRRAHLAPVAMALLVAVVLVLYLILH